MADTSDFQTGELPSPPDPPLDPCLDYSGNAAAISARNMNRRLDDIDRRLRGVEALLMRIYQRTD